MLRSFALLFDIASLHFSTRRTLPHTTSHYLTLPHTRVKHYTERSDGEDARLHVIGWSANDRHYSSLRILWNDLFLNSKDSLLRRAEMLPSYHCLRTTSLSPRDSALEDRFIKRLYKVRLGPRLLESRRASCGASRKVSYRRPYGKPTVLDEEGRLRVTAAENGKSI